MHSDSMLMEAKSKDDEKRKSDVDLPSLVVISARLVDRLQTHTEEFLNVLTHAIGVGLAIAGLVLMVDRARTCGGPYEIVSSAVFGTTLILLYLLSSVYHGVPHGPAKIFMRRFDHIGIYLLIAGTYTPFTLTLLRGGFGWTIFGIVWFLGACGITMKSVYGPFRFKTISMLGYLSMGWLMTLASGKLMTGLPLVGSALLVMGGILYTGGIYFFLLDHRFKYFHTIWHLFCVAASVMHFLSVYWYLLRPERLLN